MAQPATQLISIPDVAVSHLLAGSSSPLSHGTLSLALITVDLPTSGSNTPDLLPSAPPTYTPRPATVDQWLILSIYDPASLAKGQLGGEVEPLFELPIPATTRILQMPPKSYIIPAALANYEAFNGPSEKKRAGGESEEDEAGFIQVSFSDATDAVLIETFESIVWGLTAFSTAPPPIPARPDQKRSRDTKEDVDLRSALVLIDEANGQVLGELDSNILITEDSSLALEHQGENEKEPVVVSFDTGAVTVQPLSATWKPTPNPTKSSIISAGDYVCRGIIYGAESINRTMESSAEKFVGGREATKTPLVFGERTKKGIHASHKLTSGAVMVSGKTVALIGAGAAMIGNQVGKTLGIQSMPGSPQAIVSPRSLPHPHPGTPSGAPPKGIKGVVNRSLVAFNAVADSVELSGKSLIQTGTDSSSKMVGHKYGADAAELSREVGGSVKHVALVYIDARGVTRKALLKSVGKSALRAKMADGREVVLNENSLGGIEVEDPNAVGGVGPAGGKAAAIRLGKEKLA